MSKTHNKNNSPYRQLSRFWQTVLIVIFFLTLVIVVNQIFVLNAFGISILESRYIYVLLGAYISLAFVIYPASPTAPRDKVPWYDVLLFLTAILVTVYFIWNGMRIISEAWEFIAPLPAKLFSVILWILILEATRRATDKILFGMICIFSLYPLVAPFAPGLLAGHGYSFLGLASQHIMGLECVIGIPMRVFGNLLFGYLLFASALKATGGGAFFMDFAMSLMGKTRGGPAKVAVLGSGFLGSLSGSVVTNVITTGTVTIPLMKRVGIRDTDAAAIEACASTGGVLMPPIMGTVAFIMASFLGVAYVDVLICAVMPAIFYYYSLIIQIDAYAAKNNIKGLPASEIPPLKGVMKRGWIFLSILLLLIYTLVILRDEVRAPFYITALLFVMAMLKKDTRLTLDGFKTFLIETITLFVGLVAILAGVGLIVGALSITGVAQAFSGELVFLAGNNIILLICLGALTSFVLGIGMTVTACYVFLAITLAPALIEMGLNPLATHLFILYWGMLSFITPPVAIGTFAAAKLAGTDPTKTGFAAMKIGSVLYFLPFFWIRNPEMILIYESTGSLILTLLTALVGITIIAFALQGYVPVYGTLKRHVLLRIGLLISGFLVAIPDISAAGIGSLLLTVVIIYLIMNFRKHARQVAEG